VIPLGRLRLLLESRTIFTSLERDLPIPFPPRLRYLLRWWTRKGRLDTVAPWVPPPPVMTLTTDASDTGWGYQSSIGHQGSGRWTLSASRIHINVRELRTVHLALQREHSIKQTSVLVLSDNSAVIHCLNRQGSSRSPALLRESESIFTLAKNRDIHTLAFHLAGKSNQWADSLSRQTSLSVDWTLQEHQFALLTTRFGRPRVDLFASPTNRQLPVLTLLISETPGCTLCSHGLSARETQFSKLTSTDIETDSCNKK